MPDPTKEEQAKAASAASAATAPKPGTAAAPPAPAPAAATAPAPIHADATPALVETLKNLEARSRPAGYASATEGLDEAPEGGKFLVRGVLVNAAGRELNEDGSLKHPEQRRVNEFGQLV
jgi:cytoskeletal protein RodZ